MNAYTEEKYESEQFSTSTQWLRATLDERYEKVDKK